MENPVTKRVKRALAQPRSLGLLLVSGGSLGLALGMTPLGPLPAAIFGFFGGLAGWVFSVYSDTVAADTPAKSPTPSGDLFDERARRRALRELEETLESVTRDARQRRLTLSPDYLQRREQLRRIVELERTMATQTPRGDSTIGTMPNDIQGEVRQFVDRAIDLSRLRAAMLRAFVRTNERVLKQELETIQDRWERTTGPAKSDLETLVQAKQEQLAGFRRLRDDLIGTEAQLDAIEAFLNTISYDQALTIGSVRQQMIRLKTKIDARRQSAEEVRQIVNDLER